MGERKQSKQKMALLETSYLHSGVRWVSCRMHIRALISAWHNRRNLCKVQLLHSVRWDQQYVCWPARNIQALGANWPAICKVLRQHWCLPVLLSVAINFRSKHNLQPVLVALWRWPKRVHPSWSDHWHAQSTRFNSSAAVYTASQLLEHAEEKLSVSCAYLFPLLLQYGAPASYF